ncbi:MAG TPA: VWA domain-containing protein [Acidimicrobiales bacterium]
MSSSGTVDARSDRGVHGFLAELRAAGLAVPVGSALLLAEALDHLPASSDSLYWAGRATLAHGPEEIATYDRIFTRYWLGGADVEDASASGEQTVTIAVDDGEDGGGEPPGDDSESPDVTLRFSPVEVLRTRDFAVLDRSEQAEVNRLMADLRLAGALRRSHRRVPSRRPTGRPDLRRTVRAALRAGGEPVRRRTTEAGTRPRRVVLLADVSGSMEPYSRALIRFAHVAVAARARVEAFTIGTRLTRLTRELTTRDPDAALARAAAAVPDWSGGTRLGEALRRFNDEWGVRGMARGAVVVILSDGWDRGDPDELAEQMARLRRVAHRIVWVNPLKAGTGYEPLARGMAAALPFVDVFLEGHSLESLEALAATIADRPTPRSSSR